MSRLFYSTACTEKDVDLAIRLATSVFSEKSGLHDYDNFKSVSWHDDPTYTPNNIILARASDGSVRGLVRIVPRNIFRGNESFSEIRL